MLVMHTNETAEEFVARVNEAHASVTIDVQGIETQIVHGKVSTIENGVEKIQEHRIWKNSDEIKENGTIN